MIVTNHSCPTESDSYKSLPPNRETATNHRCLKERQRQNEYKLQAPDRERQLQTTGARHIVTATSHEGRVRCLFRFAFCFVLEKLLSVLFHFTIKLNIMKCKQRSLSKWNEKQNKTHFFFFKLTSFSCSCNDRH